MNRWVGWITPHARQRYVERVLNPDKFHHLARCKAPSCPTCVSLLHELRRITQNGKRFIDVGLRERIFRAKAEGKEIKNPNFLEVIRKRYSDDRQFEFLHDNKGVYVIVHPPDEPSPVLLTVMSYEMIDGMVIQAADRDELITYFDRWKRDARQRNQDREIKQL